MATLKEHKEQLVKMKPSNIWTDDDLKKRAQNRKSLHT